MKTPMTELIEMIIKTMGNAMEEKGFYNACKPFLEKEKEFVNEAFSEGHKAGNYNRNNKDYYNEFISS